MWLCPEIATSGEAAPYNSSAEYLLGSALDHYWFVLTQVNTYKVKSHKIVDNNNLMEGYIRAKNLNITMDFYKGCARMMT